MRGMVVTFGLGSSASSARCLGPWILRGRHFWPRGPRNRGGGVLYRALRAFGPVNFAWSSLLASRAAKPWRGRALQGSGGSGALLDPWILRGRHFWPRGPRNRGAGVLYRALAVAACAFEPVDFAWNGRHFWPPGPRNRGAGVL